MNRLLLLPFIFAFFSCNPSTQNNTAELNERLYLSLGGEEQYVEVIGTSADNPVLLFVHGGPAWPQTPQTRYYNTEIADKFTLVLWEQRGAGKSYMKNPEPVNLSLDQIVKDGLELTQWLKGKYEKEQIYLAGYSWGSVVGVKMAEQSPNDYHAYLGIAQFINKEMGVEIGRRWLREQVVNAGNEADMAVLDSLENPANYPNKTAQFFRHWQMLNKYRGAVYNAEADKETEKAMAMYDDYKDYDWYGVWKKSSEALRQEMDETNILDITALQMPVYLFEGRHDWNVPAVLALEWLESLEAPKKEIFWFEESGHGPLEEEPKKFNEAVLSIVE